MQEKVLDIIQKITGAKKIRENLDMDLFETGLMDSLGFIELIVEIEREFGVDIEPTSIQREEIATANLIIKLVKERMGEA